jgi:hypothetical protein
MAQSIGPGDYFQKVNQQVIKGLDPQTAESLRQAGGTANAQRDSFAPRKEARGPSSEDRVQPALAPPGGAEPEGSPPEGKQAEARREAARLAAYDDPETLRKRTTEDIPRAQREAAKKILESRLQTDSKQVMQLKNGPEAQEAGKMELARADFLSEPLEIRDSENDRSSPLMEEFPASDDDPSGL